MAQTKEELEKWYEQEDPWGYQGHPDDSWRKQAILDLLLPLAPFKRALDIGAGEGWITKDLPAQEIHAIELSDKAASRLPENVKRVFEPEGKYDLIVASGVLYDQYDHKKIAEWIDQAKVGVVIVGGIVTWLKDPFQYAPKKSISREYREYQQVLKLYE